MDNIFARLAKKITKKVEKNERGCDSLASYRITGLNKLSTLRKREDSPPRRDYARPEELPVKVAAAFNVLRRVVGDEKISAYYRKV